MRAAQLNPVEDHSPELLVPAPSAPVTVATVAGTELEKTVPLANEAHNQTLSTEVSFGLRNGNASADEEKNVTTRESYGLVSETASKYRQSNTELLIRST